MSNLDVVAQKRAVVIGDGIIDDRLIGAVIGGDVNACQQRWVK
jgi:hypothetical protein